MNRIKTISATLILAFVSISAFAQLVKVKDIALASELCKLVPEAMNSTCDSLDTIKALDFTGNIDLNNNAEINSIEEIKYFKNITTIDAEALGITDYPALSNFPNLNEINMAKNQLSGTLDLSSNTQLENIRMWQNNITELIGIENITTLKIVNLIQNDLTSLPDFSNNQNLHTLRVDDNNLTWNDLDKITLLDYQNFDRLNCFIQAPVSDNQTMLLKHDDTLRISYNKDFDLHKKLTFTVIHNGEIVYIGNEREFVIEDVQPKDSGEYKIRAEHIDFKNYPSNICTGIFTVKIGGCPEAEQAHIRQPNTAPFEFDEFSVEVNHKGKEFDFIWYKNGENLSNEDSEILYFENITKDDEGIYYSEVSCIDSLGLYEVYKTNSVELKVHDCQTIQSVEFIENYTCTNLSVGLQSIELSNPANKFQYILTNITTEETTEINIDEESIILPGEYTFKVTDNENCSVSSPKTITVDYPETCSNAFTPNGDGIDDYFYIEGEGTASIFSMMGNEIIQIELPYQWVGTDKNGSPLIDGIYLIVKEDNTQEKVTLLR